jgi:sirohydrochlorin ferrochelatase
MNSTASTGIIIVDHGSRRAESNDLLLKVVELYRTHAAESAGYSIIEPAHMELAEPSIATAFNLCVSRGATRVVVMPYFLLPGKHWDKDIPHLTAEAAKSHPGVQYMVAAPLGLHPLIAQVIEARIDHCLAHSAGGPECDVCLGTGRCSMKRS